MIIMLDNNYLFFLANFTQDLLMYKDEGYAKIQSVVEMAQSILANTATTGHQAINDAVQKVQDEWSTLV